MKCSIPLVCTYLVLFAGFSGGFQFDLQMASFFFVCFLQPHCTTADDFRSSIVRQFSMVSDFQHASSCQQICFEPSKFESRYINASLFKYAIDHLAYQRISYRLMSSTMRKIFHTRSLVSFGIVIALRNHVPACLVLHQSNP